jgi:4-hydroxybenzoate polyprenyltransferase
VGAPSPLLPRPAASRPRPRALAILIALRPSQWTKNAVLLAPLVFALRASDPRSAGRAGLAFTAFCLLASAGYLANDLVDRERDRRHPLKRDRPIASGELSPRTALAVALGLAVAGLVISGMLGAAVLACGAGYLALQGLYTHVLKRVPVVDVFAIAAGFELRVLAGASAISVPVSSWLHLCTLLLALFLALLKRRAELVLLQAGAGEHRAALAGYTLSFLDQLVSIACACTALAYALYTLAPETIAKFGGDRLKYTIPFVLFGLFRYLFLVHRHGDGGQPERVLLVDRALQADIAAWLGVVIWAIYARQ